MRAVDKPAGQRLVHADFANRGGPECANGGTAVCNVPAVRLAKVRDARRGEILSRKAQTTATDQPCETRNAVPKARF